MGGSSRAETGFLKTPVWMSLCVFEHCRWSKHRGNISASVVRETVPNVGWLGLLPVSYNDPLGISIVSTSKRAVCVYVCEWHLIQNCVKTPPLLETGHHEMRGPGEGMVGKRGSARGLDTWGFAGDPGC